MNKKTIFSKIINKKISIVHLYQDDLVTAFYDINPQVPVHILIVSNQVIPTLNHIKLENEKMLGRMIIVASKLAKKYNISNSGYRLIMNCNNHGGQEIYHIHMHLLGGIYLGPILAENLNQFEKK